MARIILEKKGDLTKEADQGGWIPLHYAAHLGHLSMVKLLINYDKFAAYIGDKKGKKTALHIAAGQGYIHVMEELISSCPDCCELVDQRAWNVLHFAMESVNSEAVEYLHKYLWLSYLLNEKDTEGNAPLHCLTASLCEYTTLLDNSRVDKMAINRQNPNALDIGKANYNLSSSKVHTH